jgi:phosphopantothenoylcysteine decarboxylase/phosphopantothenate--cysteine ligase
MKILVTAGPTREPIDPIRFLSNRSTGKMGFAIAEQATVRGHEVKLIAGPVSLATPDGVHRRNVETAEEMLRAVEESVSWCDVLIMTAAVSDWRPAVVRPNKLKKRETLSEISLERTRDILQEMASRKGDRVYVGFAAETESLEEEAKRKLRDKGLDLIVANDATQPDAAFEADTNRVTLFHANGEEEHVPLMLKRDVATHLIKKVEKILCST